MPASCSQVPIGSPQDCDLEGPGALVSADTVAAIRETVSLDVVHPQRRSSYAVGVDEHDLGAELVVPFAEHQCGHLEDLARPRPWRDGGRG